MMEENRKRRLALQVGEVVVCLVPLEKKMLDQMPINALPQRASRGRSEIRMDR